MTEDKMIKNLTESAKMEHIRNGIRYLLSGSIEKVVNIHKGNLKYISSLEMDESMEKDEFLEGGAGKLLIKYFKYMYENFPDELSYQFRKQPYLLSSIYPWPLHSSRPFALFPPIGQVLY